MSDTEHPTVAGCASHVDHDRTAPDIDLLSPLVIRGVTLRNRIAVSPMCQYCATDGLADDWHLVHLGSRAAGGAGLICVEATAVTAQGRITAGDMGIWSDEHVEPLARIARFLKRMGSVPAIQLAHAGRKASTRVPWEGGEQLKAEDGAWDTIAPSTIPFHEGDAPPRALDEAGVHEVIAAFGNATKRAIAAGFEIIELHAAHGYLLHEFLSPLSNNRIDEYGGSLKNRMRVVLEVVTAMREVLADETPLFVRISATDWVEGGWDLGQSIELSRELKTRGVDLIDTSSGALVPHAKIPVGKNYQVPLSAAIREQAGVMTGAVGLIVDPAQANEIITSGAADLVLLGREMLREPYWALKAQKSLNQTPSWPTQYGYAVLRRR
jgi:2,4-dienoyl-CoA reductase-like NADH-dependent reductase (Old Yellow Enzyme family)